MAKQFLVVLLLVSVIELSQTHPLTLYRITRSVDSSAGGGPSEFLLPNINSETVAVQYIVEPQQAIFIPYAESDGGDLILAETQIFRPLFTYRQQVSKRMRIKKFEDQNN